ncbi:ribosome biogenesis GTPase Der [bacterium]|nr:ribosome biogenesis GTPase Der [bacterium]
MTDFYASYRPLVALIGRPNVGKSSLFNRLVGYRKALVYDEPGLTRDLHIERVDWTGVTFGLIDAGGLELNSPDKIQQKVTEKAFSALEMADVVLFVLDVRSGMTPADEEWIKLARKTKKPKIIVVNKVDTESTEALFSEFYKIGIKPMMPISAETGRGISEFLDELVSQIKALKQPEPEVLPEGTIKLALVGRPNAGKSTLLNRMLGEDRAVTDDTPGTTRDPISATLKKDDRIFTIVDTAGIRRRGRIDDKIEKYSVIKALDTIEKADVVLLVVDAVSGIGEQDAHIAGEALKQGKALIVLINKWDLAQKQTTKEEILSVLSRKFRFADFIPSIVISAQTGYGLDKLFQTVGSVYDEYTKNISTSALNNALHNIIKQHVMPVYHGHDVNLLYITQKAVKPPTFLVFSDRPAQIHFSYRRYFINKLREIFDFHRVPLKVVFRKKT